MTIWQSIALISPTQAAYGLGLAWLFWRRGPSVIAWILLADFIAILAVMAAMDFGWLVREPGNDQVTRTVLVIWCVSVVLLVFQPGPGRVMAAIGALAIPLFAPSLVFGVQIVTTSAIVNALAFIMLAVAGYGLGGDGGGLDRGLPAGPLAADPLAGNPELGGAGGGLRDGMADARLLARHGLVSPDRGGVK